jgi:hypothetical protein
MSQQLQVQQLQLPVFQHKLLDYSLSLLVMGLLSPFQMHLR